MKKMANIRNRLDADKIREIVCNFLDNHNFLAPSIWAVRMGITALTLFNFIHKARNPRRRTLLCIVDFLENYKPTQDK